MDVGTPKPPPSEGRKVPEIAAGDLESARIGGHRPGIGSNEVGTFAGSAVWAYSCPCGWSIRSGHRADFDRRVLLHDEGHSIELDEVLTGADCPCGCGLPA